MRRDRLIYLQPHDDKLPPASKPSRLLIAVCLSREHLWCSGHHCPGKEQ